jgi:hypothetical protein
MMKHKITLTRKIKIYNAHIGGPIYVFLDVSNNILLKIIIMIIIIVKFVRTFLSEEKKNKIKCIFFHIILGRNTASVSIILEIIFNLLCVCVFFF